MPIVKGTRFAELIGVDEKMVRRLLDYGMPGQRSGRRGRPSKIPSAEALYWLKRNWGRSLPDDIPPVYFQFLSDYEE